MRIAVIVTTYNRPDALAAVLEGYLAQTDPNFELLVADDGSTESTAVVIRDFQRRAPFTIQHVWQEDRGFQVAAIRNRALAATQADYIIFSDGDCIPLVDFIARHRQLSQTGYFLAGNRLLLSPEFTHNVLQEKRPIHLWRSLDWLHARWRGHINRLLPLLRLPNLALLRTAAPDRWQGAIGCNLSAFRTDLMQVNGFDENYSGWGQEDSDLVVRLIRSGVHHKSARFSSPLLHLWHKENDRSRLAENLNRLKQVLSATHTRALKGVDQYLVPDKPHIQAP